MISIGNSQNFFRTRINRQNSDANSIFFLSYRSGPSKAQLKLKKPASEAVRREREEEWRYRPV